ncbi:hypothetical protein K3495_g4445 [Podosphaera aphanis]|nr:hypothetical protein K3495_g4445 [Podosphaera aphanis]
MPFNSKTLAKKLQDAAESSRRVPVTERTCDCPHLVTCHLYDGGLLQCPGCDHKGVRKDALMVHMRKAHGRQFDYGELQHLFKE